DFHVTGVQTCALPIFARIIENKGPLGKWASQAEGYFIFPKLEGELGNRMKFNGKEVIVWSINDYLGLGNHPEVRKVDADAAKERSEERRVGKEGREGR